MKEPEDVMRNENAFRADVAVGHDAISFIATKRKEHGRYRDVGETVAMTRQQQQQQQQQC